MKFQLFLTVFLLMSTSIAFAQENLSFEPFPGNQKERYKFKLQKNFYKDDAAWKAEMDKAREAAKKLENFKGHVCENSKTLYEAMEAKRGLYDIMALLEAYGAYTVAINTENRIAQEGFEKLKSEVESKTSFFKTELKLLAIDILKAFIKEEPRLQKYEYAIMDVVRLAPHVLSAEQESVLGALYADLYMWQPNLFQKLFDRFNFPAIEVDGKHLNVFIDFEGLMRSTKREAREQAFTMFYSFFAQHADLAAFGLRQLMKTLNSLAKLRGYETFYHQSLFEMYSSHEQIDALYSAIERALPLYHDYQKWRMEELKKDLKIPEAKFFDIEMPPKGAKNPRFTGETGIQLLCDALSGLGATYSVEIKKFLSPEEGHIDLVGGPKRQQGAFCNGCFGFYMDNFQGYIDDVSTMAHESGHNIHYQLAKNKNGSIMFGDGPNYMTESFAMFNEWVVRDYLLNHEKDSAVQKALSWHAVNEMMYLWELARRAKFEMISYDRIATDEIKDEKGFNKACTDIGRTYDLYFQKHPELQYHWMRKHHYWSVPGYYINYVLAHSLALTYFDRYRKDPKGFSEKYIAMVSNGFDRPATALLKDFLGIDIGDPKFLDGVFKLITTEFEKLKKLS
ncbi:MAG: M3 family oligoendopeptidase [Candidatus Riflebacteria bacterium]|nr:M3 family oligoendopeptidase [Candidatus Riflebacteria bacterium]